MATTFSRTTRALTLDSPRLALTALGVAAVLLFAWLLWFAMSTVSVVEASKQARIEVGSAPREVSALQSGRLAATNLLIGRQVHAGDLLAELDGRAQQFKLAEAQARLNGYPGSISALKREIIALQGALQEDRQAAGAGVQSAWARVAEAAANEAFARDMATRQKAESLSGGSAQIEAARAAAEAAKAAAARDALYAEANRIARDANTRGHQNQARIEALTASLHELENAMLTTRETIAQLQLDIENRQVRAPIDGVIGDVQLVRPGAYVTPGQKLATIVPRGELMIVATFDPATGIGRLRKGQAAQLHLDGYPWAQYGTINAHVQRVASEIRDQGLRVELKVADASSQSPILQHGMTGKVDVTIEKTSPAILLLRAAGRVLQ